MTTVSTPYANLKVFHNASNLLRLEGLDAGMPQLREFCLFLFLKIMGERNILGAKQAWISLTELDGDALKEKFDEVIREYENEYGSIFADSQIQTPSIMEQIVRLLDAHNFTATEADVKGQALEHFLTAYSTGNTSALGQFFTPRIVTDFIADLMRIEPPKTVLDPFCGTGGMLLSVYESILRKLDPNSNIDYLKLKYLRTMSLHGSDISEGAASLAKMNMIILGCDPRNITHANAFERDDSTNKFDCVITNIPFGMSKKTVGDELEQYVDASRLSNPDMNTLCVVKCVESLREGGEAAIVLPYTVCSSDRYSGLREYLKSKTRIDACFRLPNRTFSTYTSARTAILILKDAHQIVSAKSFIFAHLKNDGMAQNASREPVPENDFPIVLDGYLRCTLGSLPDTAVIPVSSDKLVPSSDVNSNGDGRWCLRDILDIKPKQDMSNIISSEQYYAEPRLNSKTNTITTRGKPRLGFNFKGKRKTIAEAGDIIIGTLHTNNGNGLFGIADRTYVCDSQLVGVIKQGIPVTYVVECLKRSLPEQLIPDDLVGRETFTAEQILSVTLPKPNRAQLKRLQELDADICELTEKTDRLLTEIRLAVP